MNRLDIEAREARELAPYAALASATVGRVYPIPEHDRRTAYQRDRDRIVHCAAFRRMEYKTQVFLPHEGDHNRTRLTHTIEVAQIARTMARTLGLNEDLTEAIALVHDLGHTPYGHAGEDVLNDLLAARGGFNHNLQSLRVVDLLEQRYVEHPGLNLTFEVREGIVKHESGHQSIPPEFDPEVMPTLEAALVDIADEIAYNAHDIDDGIRAEIIAIEDLRDLSIWLASAEREGPFDRSLRVRTLAPDQKRYALVRWLIDKIVTDVLAETAERISAGNITDLDSVRQAPMRIVSYSELMTDRVSELKSFLHARVYRHDHLVDMAARARDILETLFARYVEQPKRMPERFREMLLTEDTEVVVADYIAGMTDRFAERAFIEDR